MYRSARLTAAARTRTRICPGPGVGTSTSRTSHSGPAPHVRNPDAVRPQTGLTVVRGSLDDRAALAKAFAGSDAVISAIGVALRAKKPST